MTGWPMMPGVPAAGHVTRGGWWHPGGESACPKTPCAEARSTRLEVGDGVVYRPYPGGPAEDGVVTRLSADPTMVFVRYRDQHPGAAAKATPIRLLERTSGSRPLDRTDGD